MIVGSPSTDASGTSGTVAVSTPIWATAPATSTTATDERNTMTITDVPMLRRIEEALARNPGKRRRRINSPHPSEHALRESGFSEHDVKILVEGAEHEARWRQEQVGSSDVSSHAL